MTNIYELFEGFDMLCAYICIILLITKKKFSDHLKELIKVLQKRAEALLRVKAEKSIFG